MDVKGNYTFSTLFSKADGPFTIVLRNVFVKGNASLAVGRDGRIRTKDIKMDISFGGMSVDFQNLGMDSGIKFELLSFHELRFSRWIGFFAGIFQSFINSAPTLVFDAIKPLLLSQAYVQISQEIDSSIEKISGDHRFPNSISPLDMVSFSVDEWPDFYILILNLMKFICRPRPLLMHEKKFDLSVMIRTKSRTTIILLDYSTWKWQTLGSLVCRRFIVSVILLLVSII